jgi:uncharacterized protein (TIRG00374 family)
VPLPAISLPRATTAPILPALVRPAGLALPVAPPAPRLRLGGAALRYAIGAACALVLVYAFTKLVNIGSVLTRLRHLNVALALLCGAVFLSAYVVRALRWRQFLGPRRVGVGRVIAVYQVAQFVNWLLPIRGGELVKGVLLRQLDGMPMSESLPTVAMDKTMDLLPAVGLLALLPFLPFHLSRPLWALLLTVLVVLVCGALFLGLAARRRDVALRLLGWGVARLPRPLRGIEPFVMRFVDALLAIVARPRLLAMAALYTVGAVCLDALFCMLAFQAVGAAVTFPMMLFGYTFFNLAFILPTPPGQIGSNEVLGLLLFSGLLGINRPAVAAMFLFSHPWTAILMVISGLLCLSGMGLTLRSTLALTRRAAPAAGDLT